MLKYKDYVGKVDFDAEGKIFTGEVLGLTSVITFQGRNSEELEESFRSSIDLFLKMCAEDGVDPERAFSGRFNLRLSPDLHRKIVIQAAKEGMSLNEWVVNTIQKEIR